MVAIMFNKRKKSKCLKIILPLFHVYVNGLVVQYDIPIFTVFQMFIFLFSHLRDGIKSCVEQVHFFSPLVIHEANEQEI